MHIIERILNEGCYRIFIDKDNKGYDVTVINSSENWMTTTKSEELYYALIKMERVLFE